MDQDFLKKLKSEVKSLEEELHVKLPKELKIAREHGDLSENAEYHAAKERQGYVNARLGQLRKRLAELSMIDLSKIPRDRVSLGSEVHLYDVNKKEELVYRLIQAANLRDNETGAHIRRIGLYSATFAKALGWPAPSIEDIRLASPMHDIGKVGIPDRILLSSAILAQAKAFKGVGLAITGVDLHQETPQGVLVLHPGEDEVMRGLMETAAQFLPPTDPIAGYPTVQISESDFSATIAFTARLVVLGTDRTLVQGVVERLKGETSESLATVALFNESVARREYALFNAFANAQQGRLDIAHAPFD